MVNKYFFHITLSVALAAMISAASAQDLEPRAYVNTPVGMNFLIAGFAYAEGGVASDPSLPLENAHLRTKGPVLAYARALDVFGNSGKFDVILPIVWLTGRADFMGAPVEREISGLGDPRFRFSVNVYGAPALSMEELKKYEQDLIIGVALQVKAPLGQYDPNRLVNIGSNRWAIRPEIGASKALGPLTLEAAVDGTFFTDNDNFFRGMKLEQDPIYSVQGHLVYRLGPGIWVAIDGNYYFGGRTTIDGDKKDTLQQNSRGGG